MGFLQGLLVTLFEKIAHMVYDQQDRTNLQMRGMIEKNMTHSQTLFLSAALTLALTSCSWTPRLQPASSQKMEVRPVENFDKLAITGTFDVEIDAGESFGLTLYASDKQLQKIYTSVRDGKLFVEWDEGMSIFEEKEESFAKIKITAPSLDDIFLHGAAILNISDIDVPELRLTLSGSGAIFVEGEAPILAILLDGSGTINAAECPASTASVLVKGSGVAMVTVSDYVDAAVQGSGSVNIFGSPSRVEQSVEGAGAITIMSRFSQDPGP